MHSNPSKHLSLHREISFYARHSPCPLEFLGHSLEGDISRQSPILVSRPSVFEDPTASGRLLVLEADAVSSSRMTDVWRCYSWKQAIRITPRAHAVEAGAGIGQRRRGRAWGV
ncbi:hypothetical protein V2G26_019388 [Clonostachys chloroleuca]